MSSGAGDGVRLVCPLCATLVADGVEPAPGVCPGCGARYAGGAGDVPAAVRAALAHLGAPDLPADRLAQRLFEVEQPEPRARRAAITSDRRPGFYLWWVFVRPDDGGPREALESLLRP